MLELPAVYKHKWEYNYKALEVLHLRYDALVESLEDLANHGRNFDGRATSEGLMSSWKKFEAVFHLLLFRGLFDLTTPLSKTWQSEDIDLTAAVKMAQETISTLSEHREGDDHFQTLWKEATEFASAREISHANTQTRRKKRPSSRLLDAFVLESTGVRDNKTDEQTHCRTSI